MSEDWFEYVALPSGRVMLIGSDKDGNQIEIMLEGEMADRITHLEARHQREMASMLRFVAGLSTNHP